MKKLESNSAQNIFHQKKTFSVETITQSFNVIRIYLPDGIYELDEHLEQIEVIRGASADDVIEVHCISNKGGYVDTIIPLCNALATTPAHTICFVEGHCASAGTFPAMVCDSVEVGAYSSFMLHCASGGTGFGTMVNSAESARFFEKQYSGLLEDIYNGFVTPCEARMLHDGREIYLSAEEIQERLENRKKLLAEECDCEECSEECDDTCSSTENPCKECLELPEIKLEEENIPPVKKSSPSKKSSTKKAKALVVGSGKSPVVSLQQKERFNKLAKNPKLTEGRSFPEVDLP